LFVQFCGSWVCGCGFVGLGVCILMLQFVWPAAWPP
jgi:hypothetical protein